MDKNEIINFLKNTYGIVYNPSDEIIEFEDYYVLCNDNCSYMFNKRNKDINSFYSLKGKEKVYMIPKYTKLLNINRINANKTRIKELKKGIKNNYVIINGINMENNEPFRIIVPTKSIFLNSLEDIMREDMIDNSENKKNNINAYTPNLDKYGYDLTTKDYLKDPSIGRENEIRKIEQILLYPEKDKSIIIVGDAGVGKTSLVHGLAYRIQKGDVPYPLKDTKIISINISSLVAGTKYVGTLEEKMISLLDEASKDKNIILFMDEIHQAITGGRADNSNNSVAEILKPYLDFGRVRVIGATTKEEYNNEIEQNQAFKTRFKKIEIDEPNYSVIYDLLDDMINKYNKISYSKLQCSDEEKDMYIKWLIKYTSKKCRDYFDRSSNPRLVVDILKEVYAIANINERENIIKEDFIEAINNEDRLSKNTRINATEELEYALPIKNNCEVLYFKLKNK